MKMTAYFRQKLFCRSILEAGWPVYAYLQRSTGREPRQEKPKYEEMSQISSGQHRILRKEKLVAAGIQDNSEYRSDKCLKDITKYLKETGT